MSNKKNLVEILKFWEPKPGINQVLRLVLILILTKGRLLIFLGLVPKNFQFPLPFLVLNFSQNLEPMIQIPHNWIDNQIHDRPKNQNWSLSEHWFLSYSLLGKNTDTRLLILHQVIGVLWGWYCPRASRKVLNMWPYKTFFSHPSLVVYFLGKSHPQN